LLLEKPILIGNILVMMMLLSFLLILLNMIIFLFLEFQWIVVSTYMNKGFYQSSVVKINIVKQALNYFSNLATLTTNYFEK